MLTTEASQERAEALALALLELRLVACVSLFPVQSFYRWEGRLERSEEVQLLLKTTAHHLSELRSAIDRLHSFQTPEWIQWQASSSGSYGLWCGDQLSGAETSADPGPFSPGGGPPAPGEIPGASDPAG